MSNPELLQQLHDIHLPMPVGMWPLAIGWWVLLILVLLALIYGVMIAVRYFIRKRAVRTALRLLRGYEKACQHSEQWGEHLANITLLMKRVAMSYYPRDRVAGLQGEVWLTFLNQTFLHNSFESDRDLLLKWPYVATDTIDPPVLDDFFKRVQQWIRAQPVILRKDNV